jgi:hypothetical protein
MNTRISTVALALLGLFTVYDGILPALTVVDSDFPNYYTSARMLLDKKDLSRLYDDDMFQGEIRSYGIAMPGKFSPFPPVTAMIMLPIAWLSPIEALRVWTVANIALFIVCIYLMASLFGGGLKWNAFLLFASGLALANNFRLGQMYLALLFLIAGAYAARARGHYALAGVLLGIGAAFKYFPVIFLPLHIARREWKLTGAMLATVALVYAAGVGVMGPAVHEEFFSRILPHHLGGDIQDPFSATFQSFSSLFRRLFVYDPALNPEPWFASPAAYALLLGAVLTVVIASTIAACRAVGRTRGNDALHLQLALVTLAGLLLLPASATYHFLLLVIPLGVLLQHARHEWGGIEYGILGTFCMIGFLPYRFFRGFEHTRAFPLAYPRLWLMSALFVSALLYVHAPARAGLNSLAFSKDQ